MGFSSLGIPIFSVIAEKVGDVGDEGETVFWFGGELLALVVSVVLVYSLRAKALVNQEDMAYLMFLYGEQIYSIKWDPNHDIVLASSSGDEQLEGEAKDGPPELFYSDGGHKENFSDFGWNKIESWMTKISVVLHIVRPTADVTKVAPTADVANVGPLADVSK
ncbi:hypothetical protein AgCh_039204 [Apium graveolens]